MNILLNKQCTWKMLETLGCGEEVNIHSSSFPRDRSLEVHGVLWEWQGTAGRPELVGNDTGKMRISQDSWCQQYQAVLINLRRKSMY